MSYAVSRRAFLRSIGAAGAGATGLAWWLRSAESRAEGLPPPKRLLVLHRPNGTIHDVWLPAGAGAGAVLGPILQPFEAVRSHMVVLGGLEIVPTAHGAASHEGGLVTLMTGEAVGDSRVPGGDDWRNTAPSLDQVLLRGSEGLAAPPISSLQLAAHRRQDGGNEVANVNLSYTGADTPLPPELSPSTTYSRLFGTLVSDSSDRTAELERTRAKNGSVLDFVRNDLRRLRGIAPLSEREKLDAHEEAIRQLERTLDVSTPPLCDVGSAPTDPTTGDDHTHVEAMGRVQLAIVRAAFTCDLTRVVTYMWATGGSLVGFELDGVPAVSNHHSLSHQDLSSTDVKARLGAIDRWYSERTAEFLSDLATTPDPAGGVLLDNTLVFYLSEVSRGDHRFDDMPLVLFGGAGIGLEGGRILDFTGRTTNDLWLSIAPVFGVAMDSLGAPHQYEGPLPGLFASA
jgi:hypothetical protein